MAALPPRDNSKWPRLKLHWRDSLITRIAWVVSLILVLSFVSSVFIGMQSINTLAHLIHDDDIDKTLDVHLQHIKEIHALRQQLLVEKLKPYVEAWTSSQRESLSKIGIQTWLETAGKDLLPAVTPNMINQISPTLPEEQKIDKLLLWLDKDNLQILNFIVSFPKGPLFQAFEDVKELRQRYHLLGTELSQQIRPTLIKANAFVLIISFLILAFTFFFLAKNLQTYLQEILHGFERWRYSDFNFRFGKTLPGEFGIITRQFNAMARNIETSRQKSLYLEKVASWQVIARKLAHEIKNPLTPIQMMVSQLARFYKGDDPQFKQLLEKAHRIVTEEVAGLRHLVDHFSHFARLPEPTPEEKDLLPILAHTIDLQKAAYPQHDIHFAGEVKVFLTWIDENLIRQVFLNLIKNAAEACGQSSACIKVYVTETSRFFTIHVEDNGPGIPEDIKKRIFEAYFTTKHTGPSPGMGLGLAICQKIVLDHKGELSVQSQPGNTIFQVKLPKKK